ncbi:hypothetical protein LFM09_19020 [Lentzea alba]|uniref:hypothetical protein n=1 Tax=Lentzea alba TaxID=2714351 RepID=UPI0039BF7DCB
MKRKSPQEKKALSYAKDRRNTFGQNDKASRKNIARNKRIRARMERHQALAHEPVDDVEGALHRRASWRSWWRKLPDAPLGEVIARKLARRR